MMNERAKNHGKIIHEGYFLAVIEELEKRIEKLEQKGN